MKRNRRNIVKSIVCSVIIIFSLVVMSLFLYQNIKLRQINKELENSLEEYKALKEDIDNLNSIKNDYNLIKINNEELTNRKAELKQKKEDLNTKINNLKKEIEKFK